MKKDAFYFPHFSNARNDSKLMRVRRVFGIEGYGIYFMILEVLRDQTDFKYPIDGIEDLAFDWHIGKEKLISIINDFGLFTIDDNQFFSTKLIDYLMPYYERSQKAKKAIGARWERMKSLQDKYDGNTNVLPENYDSNTNVLPENYVSNTNKTKQNKTDQNKTDHIKTKRNKENVVKHSFDHSPIFVFENFKKLMGEKYQEFDLAYYHEAARLYSDSKGARYVNWLAAVQNWINRDIRDNKAYRLNKSLTPEQAKIERNEKIKQLLNQQPMTNEK